VEWTPFVVGGLFTIGLIYNLARIWRRSARNSQLEQWVRNQPVTYETSAKVRIRARYGGWVDLKNGLGSVRFVVRTEGIEISLKGGLARVQGTPLGSECFLSAPNSTMWLDRIGVYGTPLFRRRCIRLSTHDNTGPVDLAVSPSADIEVVWQALLKAGARPDEGHDLRSII